MFTVRHKRPAPESNGDAANLLRLLLRAEALHIAVGSYRKVYDLEQVASEWDADICGGAESRWAGGTSGEIRNVKYQSDSTHLVERGFERTILLAGIAYKDSVESEEVSTEPKPRRGRITARSKGVHWRQPDPPGHWRKAPFEWTGDRRPSGQPVGVGLEVGSRRRIGAAGDRSADCRATSTPTAIGGSRARTRGWRSPNNSALTPSASANISSPQAPSPGHSRPVPASEGDRNPAAPALRRISHRPRARAPHGTGGTSSLLSRAKYNLSIAQEMRASESHEYPGLDLARFHCTTHLRGLHDHRAERGILVPPMEQYPARFRTT
ncbi:hypothetical protein B0H11DRAFT_1946198, partial [Mycena galericulata]